MNITGDAKTIAQAFIKARGEMNATVTKDGTGNYGKYATLAAIVEATAAAFSKHGLAIIQEAQLGDSGVTVDTWLIHESGATMQFASLTLPLADRKPQAVGSAVTYARRYQLASVCGLAPDDDDGQAAQDATKSPQKAQVARNDKKAQDNPFEPEKPAKIRLTPEQAAMIAHLGKDVYGDEWDDNMDKLAVWASQGARSKLGDLYEIEAEKVIKALNKRIQQINESEQPQTKDKVTA